MLDVFWCQNGGFEGSGAPPGTFWLYSVVWEAKSSKIARRSHSFWDSMLVTFGNIWDFLFETFLGASPGLLGDFWAEKVRKWNFPGWAGHAFGPCLAVFGEGRPFSQEVASETPPGCHFDDF